MRKEAVLTDVAYPRPRGSSRGPIALVGWNEYVAFPAWGILNVRAKIDTGARSSALHVENLEEHPGGFVRFDVVPDREEGGRRVRVEARIVRRSRVRSSTGHYDWRFFVSTLIRIGPVEREVELSLVDRGPMTFRMLIGRSALGGAFLVDVARSRLHGKARRVRHGKKRSRR